MFFLLNRLLRQIFPRCYFAFPLTPQITGGKKQSEEQAVLFDVRVNLLCCAFYSLITQKPLPNGSAQYAMDPQSPLSPPSC
jgi:hypothetical protein